MCAQHLRQQDIPMASPRLLIGRFSESGAAYIVTTVTRDRTPALVGDAARWVAAALREMEASGHVENIAWAVMPDHLHWMFELCCPDLATPVRRLKSLTARRIALPAGTARLWQHGYFDHRIRHDEDLCAQVRYIVANPARSGLVAPGQIYEHVWSRYET
jgi:putative transposase